MNHLRFVRLPPHGEPIRGDVRFPDGPLPKAAIVVVHGFKGFKDWGFFPHAATRLAAAGFFVVSFNFSRNGIGEIPDEFTELDSFGGNTYSRELEDLHWVLGEVVGGDLLPRRPDRIGLLGHSRGGADVILATRERDDVGALVTWAAVANLDRWAADTRHEWRERGRLYVLNSRTGQQMPLDVTLLEDFEADPERFDVLAAAAEVTAPWLIVHGTDDLTVQPEDGEALGRANRRATVRLVEGAGHTFEVGHPFEASSRELDEAIRETVRHVEVHLGVD